MFSIGLSEVALPVADVEASKRFYAVVVGLEPDTEGEQFAFFWAGEPGSQQRLILLSRDLPPVHARDRAPAGPPPRPGSPFEELAPGDLGTTHFAFHVPGHRLADAVAHVAGCGVEIYGPVDFGEFGTAHYFLDPDGHWVEFWTPNEAAP